LSYARKPAFIRFSSLASSGRVPGTTNGTLIPSAISFTLDALCFDQRGHFSVSVLRMAAIDTPRETSVVFAATIGRLFLKERPIARRIIPVSRSPLAPRGGFLSNWYAFHFEPPLDAATVVTM
jgi:hypothetical protein